MNTTKTIAAAGHRSPWGTAGMGKLALGLVVAAAGALASPAWSQADAPAAGGPGAHGRMHPQGGPAGGGLWAMHPKRLDRLLDAVRASDAQKAQVRQIVQAAAADMAGQREAGRALHERAMAVFTAPTVDANAAEQVRQQMLSQHDQASRRMMTAMLDISRVLTPEQRALWAEQMRQRQARHGRGRP